MKPEYADTITKGSIVLLYTGFVEHYHTDEYFTKHPVVSNALAQFLLEKQIKILGMDMPSPDYPPFLVHKMLLSKDIFILENLTNLQSLFVVEQFEVFALPLKVSAEASFVRAVCRTIS